MELIVLSATTAGVTGAATKSVTSSAVVQGKVESVYIDVPTGGTATCALSQENIGGGENILAVAGITSSAMYFPRRNVCNYGGTVMTFDGSYPVPAKFAVSDNLSWSVTAATTNKTFTVEVLVG
jgi:hypothetical protein